MPQQDADAGRAVPPSTPEDLRLADDAAGKADWRLWGTYLPERQWGTVREDYDPAGEAWTSFSYDDARHRAFRWGEDGLLGWTDRDCQLCVTTALWNGRDPHLKERFFGLTNAQGNHGEDVKDLYYYLDAVPTGAYARALYKYPQAAFPYDDLVATNAARGFKDGEYELLDTGVFDGDRYFDVGVEYAKRGPDDVLVRLSIANRGPEPCDLTVLPTLVFRNTWSWDDHPLATANKPALRVGGEGAAIHADHDTLGAYRLDVIGGKPDAVLFTENDTNRAAMGWAGAPEGFTKDAFHRAVVEGDDAAANPARAGTKACFVFRLTVGAGDTVVLHLRLRRADSEDAALDVAGADACFADRKAEADAFYGVRLSESTDDDDRAIARQAYAGLLWSRQYYAFSVRQWLDGDPAQPAPAPERRRVRNGNWRHFVSHDVLSVPDKWEYPWFAAWDLAFHMLPLAQVDADFAKQQLLLLLSERYLHPNGALPAYEYEFGDVNPPVHAFAAIRVYAIDRWYKGKGDIDFLESAFLRLLLNFTWWVNRNDPKGKDLFSGGFLGLDNIGLFDRNTPLPDGGRLNQADATAWMGLFCATMQTIAVELAQTRPVYQDLAVKFLHHYFLIIDAINSAHGSGLWDEEEGFFFDQATWHDQPPVVVKVHSIVGLVPLFAIAITRKDQRDKLPAMVEAVKAGYVANPRFVGFAGDAEVSEGEFAGARFAALVPKDRLLRILTRVLDEEQFLSPHGIRSVSKRHEGEPFTFEFNGRTLKVDYQPGESRSGAFGGNSNWRGPVWFPINLLIIHAFERYHEVYGDDLKVECPVGSGTMMTLAEVARDLSHRLIGLFRRDAEGRRPCHGEEARYAKDPHWRDLVLFNEYFHADTGRGLGASHQTGWTAGVATCIEKAHRDGR